MNSTKIMPSVQVTRKLTLRKALSSTSYYYNHVDGRRAPRVRYSTSVEAFTEAKRLREQLGLVVRTYAATEITEDTK
jgi:hypothetical protein